jgi:hypothetical protein
MATPLWPPRLSCLCSIWRHLPRSLLGCSAIGLRGATGIGSPDRANFSGNHGVAASPPLSRKIDTTSVTLIKALTGECDVISLILPDIVPPKVASGEFAVLATDALPSCLQGGVVGAPRGLPHPGRLPSSANS